MTNMYFNCRDILKSARIAFSFQRLGIQFTGLAIGYLAYVILTFAALALAGNDLGVIWSRYGLIPSIAGSVLPWYSMIVYVIGVVVLAAAWLVSALGVSRATYMHLKGNTFYTWKEALNYAIKKKGAAVIATPIAIAFILFFTGLGGVVVGLLGRIPWIGPIGLSLFSAVWFLASFFMVFVGAALAVSLLQTPAVLATTDDDAFEGVFQSFSLIAAQPVRLILYELLLLVVTVLGTGVLALVAKKAWLVMTLVLKMGMGQNYADLSYAASTLLQNWIYPLWIWAKSLMGDSAYIFLFSHNFTTMDLAPSIQIASTILAIFMTLIGAYLLCYPFAVFNAGNTIIFLNLKKMKDDENLLERVDKEEEEVEEGEQEEESKEEDEEDKKEE